MLSRRDLILIGIAACLGALLVSIDGFILNVALPTIAGELGVRDEISIWLITLFTVPYAIAVPLAGRLCTHFGSKAVFLGGMAIFFLGCALCGLSFNYNTLLVCRIIQGFGAGIIVPSSRGLVILNFPKDKRVVPMNFWIFAVMVGPALGPTFGGLLSNVHWHWLFYSALPIAALCFCVVLITPTSKAELEHSKMDWIGLALLAAFIISLQVIFSRGQVYDWFHSKVIVTMCVLAALCFPLFLIWELCREEPMGYIQAFGRRNFTIATCSNGIVFASLFATFSLEVFWVHNFLGYPPMWAGLVLIPVGIMPMFLFPLMPTLMNYIDMRILAFCGALCFAISFFWESHINLYSSYWDLALPRLFQGIGIPLLMTPNSFMYMKGISDKRLPIVFSMYSFSRMLMSGLGVAIGMILWIHRRAFYKTRLCARSYIEDERFTNFLDKVEPITSSTDQLYDVANSTLEAQAATLGLADIYYLFAWCSACVCVFVLCYNMNPSLEVQYSEDLDQSKQH